VANLSTPVPTPPLKYDNLDHLSAQVTRQEASAVAIWKADLADAFFHVSIASQDRHSFGFHLDDQVYVDNTLNFGGRSSPFLFNLTAEGVHGTLASLGLDLTHYLDDFFGLSSAANARQFSTCSRVSAIPLGSPYQTRRRSLAKRLKYWASW
jgi:hypothetical protein